MKITGLKRLVDLADRADELGYETTETMRSVRRLSELAEAVLWGVVIAAGLWGAEGLVQHVRGRRG